MDWLDLLAVQGALKSLLQHHSSKTSILWHSGKESACQSKWHGFDHWSKKIPWRKTGQPAPVFLPGKSCGQRSLAGYSPWGRKRVGHNWARTHALILNNTVCFLWYTYICKCTKENLKWWPNWEKWFDLGRSGKCLGLGVESEGYSHHYL